MLNEIEVFRGQVAQEVLHVFAGLGVVGLVYGEGTRGMLNKEVKKAAMLIAGLTQLFELFLDLESDVVEQVTFCGNSEGS